MANDTVKVVCRIRPQNKLEIQGGYSTCVEYDATNITVNVNADAVSDAAGGHDFAFDNIFGPETEQAKVFTSAGQPLVEGILQGFNATIFAYGQTGSGKTHTMEGDLTSEEHRGIIPRMFDYLFQTIEQADEEMEFQVKVSFLEIYMEKIMDLLDPKKSNLQVRKDKTKGVVVKDSTEIYVSSVDEMFNVMRAGSKNRSVASTRMNETSSRSHSLFLISVF